MMDKQTDSLAPPEHRIVNFISIAGFICAVISIPLFFLCVGQLLALLLSVIGLIDTRKCNNRGAGFAVLGIIISGLLIIATPIAFIQGIHSLRDAISSGAAEISGAISSQTANASSDVSSTGLDTNLLLETILSFFNVLPRILSLFGV